MPVMINNFFIEIYWPNMVYHKGQLIPYSKCYHNCCLYFSIHSFHNPNSFSLFYYFSTLSSYFITSAPYNTVMLHSSFCFYNYTLI